MLSSGASRHLLPLAALIDYKGGATFTRLDTLPHTSAVITNLEEELHLVDRMTDAINGELIRRQELLRAAGNFASLRDYNKARAAGAPLPEVPTLLVRRWPWRRCPCRPPRSAAGFPCGSG